MVQTRKNMINDPYMAVLSYRAMPHPWCRAVYGEENPVISASNETDADSNLAPVQS